MNKKYILLILTIFIFLIISGIIIVGKQSGTFKSTKNVHVSPSELLQKSLFFKRYIDSDEIAVQLINEDPSILLVDLRDKDQFEKFTLPNAVNIPFENLLKPNVDSFLNDDFENIILFSNGTIVSDQAWMLLYKEGHKNIVVLKGGLIEFYQNLMNPQKPSLAKSEQEFDQYSFRKAAGSYLGLPNPHEFIPIKDVIKKVYIRPEVVGNAPVSKAVILKKKVVEDIDEEEDEEDEGC